MEAIIVDRTAAATAEINRPTATEADKDNVLEVFMPRESDKAKSTDEIATPRQELVAEDRAQSTPIDFTAAAAAEIATLRQQLTAAAARIQEKAKNTPTLDDLRERMADRPKLDAAAKMRPATAQVMHERAAGSANAVPDWPRLVTLLIAGESGFVGMT